MKTRQNSRLVFGQKSRNFRRELVSRSDRPTDSVQTLKFKLDIKDVNSEFSFEELQKLYDVIEGVQKGSLSYLLFTLILSGFRIFPKSQATINFVNSALMNDEAFGQVVDSVFHGSLVNFVPSALFERFAKIPRPRGGKDVRFVPEVLIREYGAQFLPEKSSRSDSMGEEVIETIAHLFVYEFKDWKDIRDNPGKAASLVDGVLKEYGSFPSLFKIALKLKNHLPKNSTICFDRNAHVTNPDEELDPYLAVAFLLGEFKGEIEKNDAKSKKQREYVQNHLTSGGNYEGLSWFFNAGLDLLKDTPIESTKEKAGLKEIFDVPEERIPYLQNLKEAATAVPGLDSLFKKKTALTYSDFRSSFGGHVDSWIANYVKRIFELADLVENLHGALKLPACLVKDDKDFIVHCGLLRQEVQETIDSFNEAVSKGKEALQKLSGRVDELPKREDVAALDTLIEIIDRVIAMRKSLENGAKQADEDDASAWKGVGAELKDDEDWQQWGTIEQLPKLNDLSGGVPKVQDEIEKAIKQFTALENCQKADFNRVMAWAKENDHLGKIFEAVEAREKADIEKRPGCGFEPKEQAARYLFGKLAGIVRKNFDQISVAVKEWIGDRGIFLNRKDYNKFFYNQEGMLYKSPFSNKRHETYPLSKDFVKRAADLWAEFERFFDELAGSVKPYTEEKTTFLKIQRFLMRQELQRINTDIPIDIARLSLPEDFADSHSAEVELLLKKESLSPAMFVKVFNLYDSLLNGLNILLKRERFYLRTKFSWIQNNNLVYVPKDRKWKMPERYSRSIAWKDILASGVLVSNEGGEVDVIKTFEKIRASKKDILEFVPLLIQLPHDWRYLSSFKKNAGKGSSVLFVQKEGSKGMNLNFASEQKENLLRLVGPSSFKGRLDQLLLDPQKVVAGDFTLLIDQPVVQKIEENRLKLTFEEPIASIAIPLTTKLTKEENELCPFTHVLGIDQGEAGIAYAVFKLSDVGTPRPMPVETGTVRIPSIRRLIKTVNKYRRSTQRNQKFSQKYDSTMFNIRENVAGDVCHAIVGLMQKYNAFPVLEYQVKNLESGSKQLSLVYKAVNSHFLFSSIEGQDAMRKQLWFGSGGWTIDGVQVEWNKNADEEDESDGSNKGKKSKIETKPLKVFPGFSVNASYTSKTCSCCGNNISDLLRKLAEKAKADKKFRVEVGEEGKIQIEGKEIQLFAFDKTKPRKYYARRN